MDNATNIARDELERRLQELKREFKTGEEQLALLDKQRTEVRETMLRILGAIQVLEELLRVTTEPIEAHSIDGPGNGHAHSSLPAAESVAGLSTLDGLQPEASKG